MKKQLLLLSALFLLITSFGVKAQSVDKILDGYFEVIGGKDKWKKLNGIMMEAKVQTPQGEIPMKMYRMRPNSMRVEANFQGKTIVIQAYDGKDAWGTNFMSGKMEKKGDEETKELASETFEPYYLDYKGKGHKIELAGNEEIEGTDCHKLKATKKNGDVEYLFFDKETNALVMTRSTGKSGATKGKQMDSFVGDYKEVAGLMMPHSITESIAGQKSTITISKITANPKVDKTLFSLPKK